MPVLMFNGWARRIAMAAARATGWRASDVYVWLTDQRTRGVPQPWLEHFVSIARERHVEGRAFMDEADALEKEFRIGKKGVGQ